MRILVVLLALVLATPSPAWAVVQSSRIFDGANDEVDWGNNVDVTTNDVSWCIWVNATEDASTDFWFGKRDSLAASAAGYAINQNASDQFVCHAGDGTTDQVATSGNDTDAVWTFGCCVWDGTGDDLTTYENGVSVASDTADTIGSLTNIRNLQSGEDHGNTNDAAGNVCFASIFLSKQLTVTELLEIMWKPEGIGSYDFSAPIMGDATEPEWAAKLSGTVSGTDAANGSGPAVMFGLGLPL